MICIQLNVNRFCDGIVTINLLFLDKFLEKRDMLGFKCCNFGGSSNAMVGC
jgi:hypothetical protein